MTQEEIITCLIERLDFHLDNGRPVDQDYKNYIFKLFKEAYDSGYCEHPSNPLFDRRRASGHFAGPLGYWRHRQRNSKTKPHRYRSDNVERMAVCLASPLAYTFNARTAWSVSRSGIRRLTPSRR
jgi:hypothetical protein